MIVAAARSVNIIAQSADPSSLPLLSSDGLQYLGGFRLPANSANGDSYAGGGLAVAFNSAGNSLFVSSYYGNVAEVSIPTPVNSADPAMLPFASFVQPFADPTEGFVNEATFGYGGGITSLLVSNNRLHGTAQIYYDSMNEQRVSHYSRSLQLNQRSFSGWSQVWDASKQGYVSGFLAAVPPEWRGRLGGAALAGNCCIPIVTRTSFGPSAFAFDPTHIGQRAVNAAPLLYYDGNHPTLGRWENVTTANEVYNQSTEIHGMVVVAGTRTLLYIGRNGVGVPCYGKGTGDRSKHGTTDPVDGSALCYDLDQAGKGTHAWPYRYQVWAYDLNELAAVKAGTKQPWDVVPYGVWPLNLPTPGAEVRLGGATYDAQRQILYVSQRLADSADQSYRPIMHAFRLDAAAPARDSLVATAGYVTMTANKKAPQAPGTAITFTAQPTGGVAPHQYKWLISDGVTTTVEANWSPTSSFTWTPSTSNANYRVVVWVRSAGNTADAQEMSTTMVYPISAGTTTAVTLVANRVAPQPAFTAITWTATPVDGVAPHQYKWLVSDGTTSTVVANWSTTNSFVWTPSTADADYRVTVWVRSAGNTADAQEASTATPFPIEDAATTGVSTPVASVTLNADKTAPQPPGSAIKWNAVPIGGTAPLLYKWTIFDGANWTFLTNWTASASYTWTPTVANPGYRIGVWVKRASNPADAHEVTTFTPFPIEAAATASVSTPVDSVTITANKSAPQQTGTAITWNAVPVGGTAPLLYKWRVFDGANWIVAANWSASAAYTWTPTAANANYRVGVWVKRASNPADDDEASAEKAFPIEAPAPAPTAPATPATPAGPSVPVSRVALSANKTAPQLPGTAITWTAVPTGGTAPLVYKWHVFDGSAWIVVANWSAAATYTWTPTVVSGNYRVSVWAKRASNPADNYEATAQQSFPITIPPASHVTLTPDKPAPQTRGTTVVFTAQAHNGAGPYQYQWLVNDGQQWTPVTDWVTTNTFSWVRNAPGNYQVGVWARSAGSTNPRGDTNASMNYVIR